MTLSHLVIGRQAQLYSSLHVTRAVLSWLVGDGPQLVQECWRAVAWFSDVHHLCVSAQMCRLLFPDGASNVSLSGSFRKIPGVGVGGVFLIVITLATDPLVR